MQTLVGDDLVIGARGTCNLGHVTVLSKVSLFPYKGTPFPGGVKNTLLSVLCRRVITTWRRK